MSDKMGEKRGMKALEAWCKKVTQGYKGVKIDNMTSSWRDGLAFCAIIHHFRPELIDFDSLDKNDVYSNNELAFRTAERFLGIPALLDPEDMVEYPVPDRLSILTYLSQFYQSLAGIQEGSCEKPERVPKLKSSLEEDEDDGSKSTSVKVSASAIRRDLCVKCSLPVYIAERLLVGGTILYHRTCYRCAHCQNQLNVANCYETEDGQHCCEGCLDRVAEKKATYTAFSDLDVIGNVGLDVYSKQFESLLQDSGDDNQECSKRLEPLLIDSNATYQKPSDNLISENLPLTITKAQSDFMSSQFSSSIDDGQSACSTFGNFVSNDEVCDKCPKSNVFIDRNYVNVHKGSSVVQDVHASNAVRAVNNSAIEDTTKACEESILLGSSLMCEDELMKLPGLDECANEASYIKSQESSIVKMRCMMFENSGNIIKEKETKTNNNNQRYVDIRRNSEGDSGSVSNPVNIGSIIFQQNATELFPEKKPSVMNSVSQKEAKLSQCNINNTSAHNESESLELEEEIDEKPIQKQGLGYRKNELQELVTESLSKSGVINRSTSALNENGTTTRFANNFNTQPVNISAIQLQKGRENIKENSFASEETYPKELNPFDEDDTENNEATPDESVFLKKGLGASPNVIKTPVSVAYRSSPSVEQELLKGPKVCLNPFWSDGEEPSSDEETPLKNAGKPPVPLTRAVIGAGITNPESSPPISKSLLIKSTKTGSVTSLSSINSDGSARKKKLAPSLPINARLSTPTSSCGSSPTLSSQGLSPTAPCRRKSRPAPPPPVNETKKTLTLNAAKELIREQRNISQMEQDKNEKDLVNLHRQSQIDASNNYCVANDEGHAVTGVNKNSICSQWKHKKGPAPPRPVPQRRFVKAMPMKEVTQELEDIEIQQQELERQGVKLEQIIREKFDQSPNLNESGMTSDVEELILQLFELVNQKNELFRRQAGLMYLCRQHRLEEEYADLEYQVRCLMEKPVHTKTDYDKAHEEELIQQLVDIVERRNEVVECLELDRKREEEEDQSIHSRLQILAGKSNKNVLDGNSRSRPVKKKSKKSKTEKDKGLLKKTTKPMHDADKDVDEVEELVPKHDKEKKKKLKWF